MSKFLLQARAFLASLRLTVFLIALAILLVFAATLDQVNLGVWAVQEKYFRSFLVWLPVRGALLPVFPGGYLLGAVFLANLVAAHFERFALSWRKLGIALTHAGLLLLLVGELLSGLWQEDCSMRLDEGQTRNYAESYRDNELAVTDVTDPEFDQVVAIPESWLAGGHDIQHPALPFRVVPRDYHVNAALFRASAASAPDTGAPLNGFGAGINVTPLPPTYKQDERNQPAARVELVGTDGSLGTWLVSTMLVEPQRFTHAGRTWEIALRITRRYQPFALTLLKFSHDRYPGTDIPRNFSSRLRLVTPDGRDDREVLIYMNNPLRHGGLTFYQSGFANDDRTTVLQVVRNPSWQLPYVACAVMALGLVLQFGMHLFGFVGRRSRPAATPAAPRPARTSGWSLLLPAGAALLVLVSLFPARSKGDFDLDGFGRLPVLLNGRIKPLDTVARSALLQLQGRQRVARADITPLTPVEWLLDVMARPAVADAGRIFEIVHPDLLTLFNLTPGEGAGQKRFSFLQLAPRLHELERQANLAGASEAAVRTPFQRAVLQLSENILLYQHLQVALVSPDSSDFLGELERVSPADPAAARAALERAIIMAGSTNLALIPPAAPGDTNWQTAGAVLVAGLKQGQVDPVAKNFARLARHWRQDQPAEFNRTVGEYLASLQPRWAAELRRCGLEARFNAAQPFYSSMLLYVAAFLVAVISWLQWPAALGRSARWLVALAWVLTTAGILTRMWLEGRPPVTNLYSSALFVGWMAVTLCLVLEAVYRNAIGSAAAGLIGFATLLIAHHLALGGDTMEMMRAVLDSNFWLATHVVTVTVGYAATFLAGFLALIYVARGCFTRSLDAATAGALTRMVYGIVCFATLFSFVGTTLGGIWADQSWGRFWGWDPKENGALIIVLWNALILHARWGGLVQQRGLMALAIFGNIVTAWSWFGVNMLGVGLHSYGFMDAAFWWLIIFAASQLLMMAPAGLPDGLWRSSRAPAAN